MDVIIVLHKHKHKHITPSPTIPSPDLKASNSPTHLITDSAPKPHPISTIRTNTQWNTIE